VELIIDAASQAARAGLSSRGVVEWSTDPLSPREHTRQLLVAVLNGLKTVHTTFQDVEVIIVSLGPGPFNGLRVAVSIAKGLAAGTGAAVVGIPTTEAEAFRCEPCPGTLRALICAGRTGFTTALFAWRDPQWVQVQDNLHVDVSRLEEVLDGSERLCGDVDDVLSALPPLSPWRTRTAATSRGSRLDALASLGWARYMRGDVTSAATLQPLYARPPHITVARDRRP
jgi:tRNA threonylcarbamoyladenosine biosynthesis protein TsaB